MEIKLVLVEMSVKLALELPPLVLLDLLEKIVPIVICILLLEMHGRGSATTLVETKFTTSSKFLLPSFPKPLTTVQTTSFLELLLVEKILLDTLLIATVLDLKSHAHNNVAEMEFATIVPELARATNNKTQPECPRIQNLAVSLLYLLATTTVLSVLEMEIAIN